MIILLTLKWLAIAVGCVVALIAALAAAFVLAVLADHFAYKLSRHRTLKALDSVRALKAKFARAISQPDRNNPLMRGFSIPLSRFDAAVETLDRRTESLEDDNVARLGPHTRSEWRHLRKDVKRILSRGKQLDYFMEAHDARDGIWPFVADHMAIYADNNYEGRQPERVGGASPFSEDLTPAPSTVRLQRSGRNFGVGMGALDEDVMPSAEERRQALAAALADEPVVTVLKPAMRQPAVEGVYDRTGKVLPFKRPGRVSIKA